MTEPPDQGPRGIKSRQGPQELRLDIPAAHSAGRMARQMLHRFAVSEGVPGEELDVLVFVAGELLDNAVDHGGGGAAREVEDIVGDARMTLLFALNGDGWSLRVEDQGGGDAEALQRKTEDEAQIQPDVLDERGRGFFLIGHMVDELLVEATGDGQGLAVVTTRRYRLEP